MNATRYDRSTTNYFCSKNTFCVIAIEHEFLFHQLLSAICRAQICQQRAPILSNVANDGVEDICVDTLARLPTPLNLNRCEQSTDSMAHILNQELVKYNQLLDIVKKSLAEMVRVIRGSNEQFDDFEKIYSDIVNSRIPALWTSHCYRTLKPLGSFIHDFLARIEFFRNWHKHGIPSVVWFSALYFPQALVTHIQHTFQRSQRIDFTDVCMRFQVTQCEEGDEISNYLEVLGRVII